MTVASSGTQTATLTTEHTLLDTSTAGVYVLRVNNVNLVVNEQLELIVYSKVLTGDTYAVQERLAVKGVQDQKILQSPPLSCPFGAKFTLTQTGGTGRAFPWSVEKLD